jgi:hypothetical protein
MADKYNEVNFEEHRTAGLSIRRTGSVNEADLLITGCDSRKRFTSQQQHIFVFLITSHRTVFEQFNRHC